MLGELLRRLQKTDLVPESIVKALVRNLLSRPLTQPVLMQIVKLCYAGLNYSGGQAVPESGEVGVLHHLHGSLGTSMPLVLFDVGASDGAYLEAALKVFGSQLNSYSFEPQSAAFVSLCKRFGNKPQIRLFQTAIGKEPAEVELFLSNHHHTMHSLHRNAVPGQTLSERVQLTTIDQFCAAESIPNIDLLKIDTEGHEMDVLLGASVLIQAGGIRAVQFEFGEPMIATPYHFVDFWEFLSPNYTIYRVLRHGLTKVARYSPDLEIYKCANFFCTYKN